MSIVVYWTVEAEPKCQSFLSTELTKALAFCQEKRNEGMRHVTLSSEMDDNVGKPGVDSIVDGKTPDGHVYDWSKAGRAGRMKASDLTKVVTRSE